MDGIHFRREAMAMVNWLLWIAFDDYLMSDLGIDLLENDCQSG